MSYKYKNTILFNNVDKFHLSKNALVLSASITLTLLHTHSVSPIISFKSNQMLQMFSETQARYFCARPYSTVSEILWLKLTKVSQTYGARASARLKTFSPEYKRKGLTIKWP